MFHSISTNFKEIYSPTTSISPIHNTKEPDEVVLLSPVPQQLFPAKVPEARSPVTIWEPARSEADKHLPPLSFSRIRCSHTAAWGRGEDREGGGQSGG